MKRQRKENFPRTITIAAGILLLSLIMACGTSCGKAEQSGSEPTAVTAAVKEDALRKETIDEEHKRKELYVIAKDDASVEEVRALAEKYEAKPLEDMADVGIYLFVFGEEISYNRLYKILSELQREECIEKADFNYSFETGTDEK